MPAHTVYARVAGNAAAVALIDDLAAAGIARTGIRVNESTPTTTRRAGAMSMPLLWGVAGALAGGALGWIALAWSPLPWFGALWGMLLGGVGVARHAGNRPPPIPAPAMPRTTRLEIDTHGHYQTTRARRICADHRAWAATEY